MELAEPSIAVAYKNCIDQGATYIVCHPYFLSKGRHYQEDIPALLAAASLECPGAEYVVTEPLGVHEKIIDLISDSIASELAKTR